MLDLAMLKSDMLEMLRQSVNANNNNFFINYPSI
jgi:hypothetical protein